MSNGGPRAPGDRPGKTAIVGAVLLHAALLIVLVVSGAIARPAPIDFEVYRVDMIAASAAEVPEAAAEEEPAPEPEPVAPEPEPEPEAPAPETDAETAVEREPEPRPAEPEPRPQPPREEPARVEPRQQPAQPREAETGEQGTDDITVQIEGLQARYPAYYENIILQLRRYFRFSGEGRPSAEVFFYIRRDGSVDDIRIVRSSGSPTFNLEAMGAVEQAGERKAFGPLPEGFRGERLPVIFSFQPPR